MPSHEDSVHVTLKDIQTALDLNQIPKAEGIIAQSNADDPRIKNALAVLNLRQGNIQKGLDLLRPLLFPRDGFVMEVDAPEIYKINFTTALALTGNDDEVRIALDQIKNEGHPIVRKLRSIMVERRRVTLPFWKRHLGMENDSPFELDFPPGQIYFGDESRCADKTGKQFSATTEASLHVPQIFSPAAPPSQQQTPGQKRSLPVTSHPGIDTDRVIRVFISSTFRDMMRERDLLVKEVFPALRRICAKRFVAFTEVDLRWGITEEQAAEGKVLPLCLAEIERSRPYFLGFLGERYGWISDAIPAEVVEKEPWLKEHLQDHKSVTELEILHGALNNPKMTGHAFFYFRDPAYLNSIPEKDRKDYISENPDCSEKLKKLKVRIRQSNLPVVENYSSPESLANLVREQFLELIDNLYPEEAVPEPLDQEAMGHAAYAGSKLLAYVERPTHTTVIDEFVEAEFTGKGLIITGESGGGKTALLAAWVRHWRKSHSDDFIFQHYFGATPESASIPAFLRRFLGELKRHYEIASKIPIEQEKMLEALPLWIEQTVGKERMVLVLDALDQIEGDDPDSHFNFLPLFFHEHVRVIASALPSSALNILRDRGWNEHPLPFPDKAERKRIIEAFLHLYRKKLRPDLCKQVADAPGAINPLFLRTLLEELRQFGSFEHLPARVAHYLKAQSPRELFGLVLKRWQEDFDTGSDLVRRTLRFLWAVRQGLSESEWLDLLGTNDQALPRQKWTSLFLAMEPHLSQRNGLYTFGHDFLRQAVQEDFLPSGKEKNKAHLLIGEYFSCQEDFFKTLRDNNNSPAQPSRKFKIANRRKAEELPWQWQKIASYALTAGLPNEIQPECRKLAELLMSPSFIEAKCSASLVFDLVNDYEQALNILPEYFREIIFPFSKAVSNQGEWLSLYPQTTKQQLTNYFKKMQNTCFNVGEGSPPFCFSPGECKWLNLYSERPQTTLLPWRSFNIGGAVFAVALDATAQRVLFGSANGDVQVGDTRTGRVLFRLSESATVRAGALSSNGSLALICTVDGTVRLFQTQPNGQCYWVLTLNSPCIFSAIDDRDKYALLGCQNGEIQIIEIASGQNLYSKKHHWPVVWCNLALIHMELVVVSIHEDSSIMISKFGSNQPVAHFKGALDSHPLAAKILEDTEELICVFSNNETWRWSIKERLVKSVDRSNYLDLRLCSLSKEFAALVPRRFPLGKGVVFKRLDQPDKFAGGFVDGGPVSAIAVNRDGNAFATGTVTGKGQVWIPGELLSDESHTSQQISDGPFDSVSSQIVFCGIVFEDNFLTMDQQGVTALWSFTEPKIPKKVLFTHKLGEGDVQTWDIDGKPGDKAWSGVQGAFTHKDGAILVFFHQSGQVVMCDLKKWQEINRWQTYAFEIIAGAISYDASRIICVNPSGIISLRIPNEVSIESEANASPIVCASIAFMNKGVSLVAGLQDGGVCIWSDGQNTIEPVFKCSSAVTACMLSSSGNFVWGTKDGDLGMASFEKRDHVLLVPAHRSKVNACAISRDGKWVASVAKDRALLVHEIQDLELCGAYPLPDPGTALCWSIHADKLAVGTGQGYVEVLKSQ